MQKVTQQRNKVKRGGTNGRQFTFPKRKDPNALDIDTMSMEKRDKLMKARKCFYCEQGRQMVKDCQKKKGKQKEEPPKYKELMKKWKMGKELYAHIRSLLKDLDEEEYKVLMEEAKGSGF